MFFVALEFPSNRIDYQMMMRTVIAASTASNLEPFQAKSTEFVRIAVARVDAHISSLMACKKVFHDTLIYFKHIPKTGTLDECTPNQFFELWLSFVSDFNVLWKREVDAMNVEL